MYVLYERLELDAFPVVFFLHISTPVISNSWNFKLSVVVLLFYIHGQTFWDQKINLRYQEFEI